MPRRRSNDQSPYGPKQPNGRLPFGLPPKPTPAQLMHALKIATNIIKRATQAAAESALTAKEASECVATLMHRMGVDQLELSDREKRAAWDACWLRVNLEILEHDDGQANSVRLSLIPVTDAERLEDDAQ